MVGVTGFKLNQQLARYHRGHPTGHHLPAKRTEPLAAYVAPKWRVKDRLTSADVAALIAAFKADASKSDLAKHCGIGEKSVRALLREHGVQKRSRYDVQA